MWDRSLKGNVILPLLMQIVKESLRYEIKKVARFVVFCDAHGTQI